VTAGRPSLLGGVLRDRDGDLRVTSMELFFDLVYVFAVTQLSHNLVQNLTVRGAVETLVLFLAVWWAWNYTAWATNWIDPDALAVRLMLVVLMILGLVMAACIPSAFEGRALGFAGAYVAIQVVRSAFMVWALRGQRMGRNYAQLLAWSCMAGVLWIAGAAAEGDARLTLWVLALVVDFGGPLANFWLPRLGPTPMSEWTLRGGHLAERMQLVLIIALGESIIITGTGFSELPGGASTTVAFIVAFLGSVALWWVYFGRHAEEGAHRVEDARDDATRLARTAYAYAHAIMVLGVIVTAVADEEVILHPTGHMETAIALVILGGPAIYLAGDALFLWMLSGRVPGSRLVAIGALALLGILAPAVTPLTLAIAATLVLAGLVAADARARFNPPRAPSTESRI
jgi:low temperature requirement protein LtrA